MLDTLNLGAINWYHITNPSENDFTFLEDNFQFHPLDLEDCRSINQRPKIDEYDDYYFIILHFPQFDKSNTFIRTKEVKIFWGQNYIITIEKSSWVVTDLFQTVQDKGVESLEIVPNSSDVLLYDILNRLMKSTYLLLMKLGTAVETINRELFSLKAEKTISLISVTRKNIILMNTIFKPQLRLFHKFEQGDFKGYAVDMEDYWGNILDSYQKMWDMVEDYGELIEGLSKTFDSMLTNKTNEIMKILTLISAIMLPLTVITGFYGMNVALPLGHHRLAAIIIVLFMFILSGFFIFYFKKKKWM